MKKILISIIAALIVLTLLGFFKDALIRSGVEVIGSQVLGAPVKVRGMVVGILTQKVRIDGLMVGQPEGYEGNPLLDVETVEVRYDLAEALKGRIHIPYLLLKLKEVNVIKSKDGLLNVNALKISQKKQEGASHSEQAKTEGQKPAQIPPIVIDTAVLDLRKVHYWDYGKQPPGHVVYDINVHDKAYQHINGIEQFAGLIMLESLTPTPLKGVLNLGFKTIDKTFGTAVGIVGDARSMIKGLFK